MHYCDISECRATLLGFSYWAVTLDDGRVIAVCRGCKRKIDAAKSA